VCILLQYFIQFHIVQYYMLINKCSLIQNILVILVFYYWDYDNSQYK